MMFEISQNGKTAIEILNKNRYEAYFVGGCVRDLIMGKTPHDWDITTSALPPVTREIFKTLGYNTIDTGIKHGTVTIIINGEPLEITTFRTESGYSDLRRPDKVEFVSSPKLDVKRRDFTINALLYHPKEGIIDFVGGINDISEGIIKCVGNPDDRFSEDALRMMRALRFSSQLGFEIEKNTSVSIKKNYPLLREISDERLQAELNKLLTGKDVKYVLYEYREVLEAIIPSIRHMAKFQQNNPHHCYDVWIHTIEAIANSKPDLRIRLALLLHDIAKPHCHTIDSYGVSHFYGHQEKSADMAKTIMTYLKYSNTMIDTVTKLILYHDFRFPPTAKAVKRLLREIGIENFELLMEVKKADLLAQNPDFIPEKLKNLEKTNDILKNVLEEDQCFSLRQLEINGNNLLEMGIPKGKAIGYILNTLLSMVINEEIENEKHALTEAAKEIIKHKIPIK